MAQAGPSDIFALIESLSRGSGLTRGNVERLLQTRLELTGENSYFTFLSGAGSQLSDGRKVESVDLRLSKSEPNRMSLIGLKIGGRCLTLADVSNVYGQLQLVDVPRGRSPDESISYATKQEHVQISFVFKEHDPNCAAFIAIGPSQ